MGRSAEDFERLKLRATSARSKMIHRRLVSAVATCPWCNTKDALACTLSPKMRLSMRCISIGCGAAFAE